MHTTMQPHQEHQQMQTCLAHSGVQYQVKKSIELNPLADGSLDRVVTRLPLPHTSCIA